MAYDDFLFKNIDFLTAHLAIECGLDELLDHIVELVKGDLPVLVSVHLVDQVLQRFFVLVSQLGSLEQRVAN